MKLTIEDNYPMGVDVDVPAELVADVAECHKKELGPFDKATSDLASATGKMDYTICLFDEDEITACADCLEHGDYSAEVNVLHRVAAAWRVRSVEEDLYA
jgi:hypothetical protein